MAITLQIHHRFSFEWMGNFRLLPRLVRVTANKWRIKRPYVSYPTNKQSISLVKRQNPWKLCSVGVNFGIFLTHKNSCTDVLYSPRKIVYLSKFILVIITFIFRFETRKISIYNLYIHNYTHDDQGFCRGNSVSHFD